MNATSKLVKAWESKNAKNAAKAGGVSLMALSLAACGGSSTTVTTPVVDTPVVDTPVVVTPVVGATIVMAASTAEVISPNSLIVGNKSTSNDDTIYATTLNSLEAGDVVDGGDGTDTLKATINSALTNTLTSVEALELTMNVNSTSGGIVDSSFDTANSASLKSVQLSVVDVAATPNSGADGKLLSIDGDTAITLKGGVGNAGKATTTLSFDYYDMISAASTATVTVNGENGNALVITTDGLIGTAATTDKDGAETLSIVTAGSTASSLDNVVSVQDDGSTNVLTGLTLSGTQALTITDDMVFATTATVGATVDASKLAGKLTAQFSTANVADNAIAVTLGSGGSNVSVLAGGSNTAVATVTGGAGADDIDATDIGTRSDLASTVGTNEAQLVNLTINSGAGADIIRIKAANVDIDAGDGNDNLIMTSVSAGIDMLDKYDSIDMGAGEDTVTTSDATLNGTDKTPLSYISNAEILESTATSAVNIDANAVSGFSSFNVSGVVAESITTSLTTGHVNDEAVTLVGVENDDIFIIDDTITGKKTVQATAISTTTGGDQGGIGLVATPKLDGANNILNLELVDGADIVGGIGEKTSGATANAAGGKGLSAANFERVNIVLSDTDKDATTQTAFNIEGGAGGVAATTAGADGLDTEIGANGTIVITGEGDIDLNTVTGTNAIITAADLVGKLTVDGTEGNSQVTGGAKADSITTGTGADTIVGGAGADTINGGTGADTITGGTGSDTLLLVGGDTVTDFATGSGGDKIDVSNTGNAVAFVYSTKAVVDSATDLTLKVHVGATSSVPTSAAVEDGALAAVSVTTAASFDTGTELDTLFASGATFEAIASGEEITLIVAAADTGHSYVWDGDDSAGTTTWTLVATLNDVSAADLDLAISDNFIA